MLFATFSAFCDFFVTFCDFLQLFVTSCELFCEFLQFLLTSCNFLRFFSPRKALWEYLKKSISIVFLLSSLTDINLLLWGSLVEDVVLLVFFSAILHNSQAAQTTTNAVNNSIIFKNPSEIQTWVRISVPQPFLGPIQWKGFKIAIKF